MSQQSASTSAAAGKAVPPIPRPSASLVIVNHRNEVLLVQRNPKATAFGGFHVFPGGNYDKKQDKLLAITAIRETFEESGLLLASSSSPAPPESTLDEARFAIHQQQMLFQDFMSENSLKPDVDSLLPFMKWITPVGPPKRFETQFFVTFLPQTSAIAPSNFSSGEKQERLPTPDGGQEVISAKFIHPSEAISLHRQGKMAFMPPQFYILSTLSGVLRGTQNTKEQRSMVKELSNGDFGRMVINPVAKGQDEQGRTILTYEGDELRGGSKGRLHRAHLKMGKGMPGEITLIRNFDIFTELSLRPLRAPRERNYNARC
ncbi:NUDIX domain-containing protein [Coprinopsis sp. MPI-PUGE-AT-0042]|nr:NUDIX domain-containing protein [Coprinopsis sp. MPI-PUGE-AT-0042]